MSTSAFHPLQTLVPPTLFFFCIVGVALLAMALQHVVPLTDKALSFCNAGAQLGLALLNLPLLLLAAFGAFLAQQRWRLAVSCRRGVNMKHFNNAWSAAFIGLDPHVAGRSPWKKVKSPLL